MKKIVFLFITTIMVVIFAFSANALEPTGQWGDNVFWNYDADTGELVLSGEGPMPMDKGAEIFSSPFYKSDIKSVVIEEGVTTVGAYAFFECNDLEKITIADSVTAFGASAFNVCKSLLRLEISANITDIGETPFRGCYNLTEICVDSNNLYYSSDEYGVLFNKDKTALIQYPIGRKSESYNIPHGVKRIGVYAFYESENLSQINFSGTETELGMFSFGYCRNIDDIILPDSITLVDSLSFLGTEVKNIVLSESMTKINGYAFDYSDDLISVTIPKEVTIIEMGAFSRCTALETVYYGGTEEEWKQVRIDSYNDPLLNAKIYFKGVHTHVFTDWITDGDKFIRYCTVCDHTETKFSTDSGDVEIEAPDNPDKDFEVDKIEGNSGKFVLVEESVYDNLGSDWEVLKAFDINLKNKDGVHVQPDGTVKVKLPLDWEKDGNYKVYRVNDDGSLTDMNAYRQGSHMVFDTDHFSIYVIVEEKESTSEEPENPSDNCSCSCHKGGFMGFIWKILKIFYKLFNIKPVCACGVEHY